MAEPDAVTTFEDGLSEIRGAYGEALRAAKDEPELRLINGRYVGPQGELTKLLKLMPKLPGDRRRELGQAANALKQEIQATFDAALNAIHRGAREAELTGPALDVTLPGRWQMPGRLHPITRVRNEVLEIFASLGFDMAPKSSFTRTASTSSGSHQTTRRPTSTTRSSSRETARKIRRACSFAPRPRRFKSAKCSSGNRRLPSCPQGPSTGGTTMPPTHRCSFSSRASWWIKT
jgi:hypothetical protein